MTAGRPHGFVAWLFDFYFLSFFGGAVVALFLAIQGRPGSLRLALSLAAAFLIVSLVYHLVAAKRVAIVSLEAIPEPV